MDCVKKAGVDPSIVDTVIPVGATINMDGKNNFHLFPKPFCFNPFLTASEQKCLLYKPVISPTYSTTVQCVIYNITV